MEIHDLVGHGLELVRLVVIGRAHSKVGTLFGSLEISDQLERAQRQRAAGASDLGHILEAVEDGAQALQARDDWAKANSGVCQPRKGPGCAVLESRIASVRDQDLAAALDLEQAGEALDLGGAHPLDDCLRLHGSTGQGRLLRPAQARLVCTVEREAHRVELIQLVRVLPQLACLGGALRTQVASEHVVLIGQGCGELERVVEQLPHSLRVRLLVPFLMDVEAEGTQARFLKAVVHHVESRLLFHDK